MSILDTIEVAGWVRAATIRALKTAGEVAVPLIIADTVIWEQNWARVVGVTATATILSFLVSLRGIPEINAKTGDDNSKEDFNI